MRRLACIAALWLAAAPARAQVSGTRFEIRAVDDSTISFERGTAKWVRPGQVGIAVDPRRRDALVGRFRVITVDSGMVRAVITGQTTRLVTDYWAILDQPPPRWSRRTLFLGGLVFGFVIGAVSGLGP